MFLSKLPRCIHSHFRRQGGEKKTAFSEHFLRVASCPPPSAKPRAANSSCCSRSSRRTCATESYLPTKPSLVVPQCARPWHRPRRQASSVRKALSTLRTAVEMTASRYSASVAFASTKSCVSRPISLLTRSRFHSFRSEMTVSFDLRPSNS